MNSHVALVDPDLLPHLAADVGKALLAVEALGLEAAVAEHLDDLGVLLALLLEDELALLPVLGAWCAVSAESSLDAGSCCQRARTESERRWGGGWRAGRLTFSFFPRLRFLPPFPLFLGMAAWSLWACAVAGCAVVGGGGVGCAAGKASDRSELKLCRRRGHQHGAGGALR